MSIFMEVIRLMEVAIDDCSEGKEDSVHSWDVAVAYYTGTLEGVNGLGDGNLL